MQGYKKLFSDLISKKVDELVGNRTRIKILEAGCGSASHLTFSNYDIQSVGIDISKDQLEKNSFIQEKIQGDLLTYPLPSNEFDVVVCWDVLEHVSKPLLALQNMFNTINNYGILIVAFPNIISVKGLVTKWSPFWLHRLYYKWMGIEKNPFPTYMPFSMRPAKIIELALSKGFSLEFANNYDGASQKLKKNIAVFLLFQSVSFILKCLTLWKVDFTLSECLFVFQKKR